jgi:hypothetical protein
VGFVKDRQGALETSIDTPMSSIAQASQRQGKIEAINLQLPPTDIDTDTDNSFQ